MAYVKFTEQQIEKARNTNISDIIRRNGGIVKRVGSEEEWLDNGQKVSINGCVFYHQYEHKGSNAIGFVMKYMNKNYVEAVEYLIGESGGTLTQSKPIEKKPKEPFTLPERYNSMRRVYAYLLGQRGLDKNVVDVFVNKNMIYESTGYHNVVFVGYDKSGTPRHATTRSTITGSGFRGNQESSQPEFSFHWNGTNNTLYLFEAPIDMLSYISMNKKDWQESSYASCCGVGERVMYQMLKDNPNIQQVKLCLDNDTEGIKATKRIADKLFVKGVKYEILVPKNKDWNEDLLDDDEPEENVEEESEVAKCQELKP